MGTNLREQNIALSRVYFFKNEHAHAGQRLYESGSRFLAINSNQSAYERYALSYISNNAHEVMSLKFSAGIAPSPLDHGLPHVDGTNGLRD